LTRPRRIVASVEAEAILRVGRVNEILRRQRSSTVARLGEKPKAAGTERNFDFIALPQRGLDAKANAISR
jgi:hypothetical protein